jgi:hypothetical protein
MADEAGDRDVNGKGEKDESDEWSAGKGRKGREYKWRRERGGW